MIILHIILEKFISFTIKKNVKNCFSNVQNFIKIHVNDIFAPNGN